MSMMRKTLRGGCCLTALLLAATIGMTPATATAEGLFPGYKETDVSGGLSATGAGQGDSTFDMVIPESMGSIPGDMQFGSGTDAFTGFTSWAWSIPKQNGYDGMLFKWDDDHETTGRTCFEYDPADPNSGQPASMSKTACMIPFGDYRIIVTAYRLVAYNTATRKAYTLTGLTSGGWFKGPYYLYAYPGNTPSYPVNWTATLNYDANAGTDTVTGMPHNDSKSQITAQQPDPATFTIPDSAPARDGHTFDHWEADDGTSYSPGGTVTVPYDSTVTLKAVWSTPARVACTPVTGAPIADWLWPAAGLAVGLAGVAVGVWSRRRRAPRR